ncbi:transcriptional regulator, lrp family [Candidatus Caldarchaeum subterraneum]|uniref:Transcriptional regulator, lrp family n=1 Tax=Caldiarchaeum subterraneum TaxID=311458 RepID=E6N8C4_CALS0|nr:transcriptional regulator, lrp family [Candidatus Caldarchaeum subterraneum]BAJ48609.1 transcriptional regulator, lrp family [Candidatus Caldarchaeum subterraneum]BAJ49664.1 transcriptional regulator, lrp family [Candidatus Caldarchaeum subterraneum]BAJ51319.1 transcriptional regulator, lrp family [Candidatus Caldarchaeum subterraneum]
MSTELDDKDLKILEELVEDAEQTVSAIAAKVKMPRTTVQERIKRLKQLGVIKKFTVQLDHSKLGKPATAFVLVSFQQGTTSQKKLAEDIAKLPEVVEAHVITGEWDIIVKVRSESMQSIGSLVVDKIRNMPGVGKTITCVSLAAVKESV